ncbi:hypothetical protein JQ609_03760 [Bradyrhizobium sp. AUGA SZCCT0169]|uniref:hypothetical protein n=1 Tax=Bradyrhizobium sp. AUGA SZCCT0169 TaxID=2807663 RepID=UPI001BA8151B|nr:hypothetical protein [Bradyrhizobium sp. AUGA SZCCT0169]MBR1246045.1 hypothetical protein [Bradyrhizobium sp. AUGA SZCCT0169]
MSRVTLQDFVQIEMGRQLGPPARQRPRDFAAAFRVPFWLDVGSRTSRNAKTSWRHASLLRTQRVQTAAALTFKSRRDRRLFT